MFCCVGKGCCTCEGASDCRMCKLVGVYILSLSGDLDYNQIEVEAVLTVGSGHFRASLPNPLFPKFVL